MTSKKLSRQKHRTSEFRDLKLEKQFVGGILSNHEMFRRIIRSFDSNTISSDRIKWIYEKAVSFYNQEGVILDDSSFDLLLDMKVSRRKLYKSVWKNLIIASKGIKETQIIALKNKLVRLYQARLLELKMKDAFDHLIQAAGGDDKHIDSATEIIISTAELLQIKETPIIITDPIEKYEDYEIFHKKVQKNPKEFLGVPTGINGLDSRMKGLRNSEFGLVSAGTGIGKSVILLDMATHAWLTTGDVVYVTIEMPEDQIRQRFYCRLSGIDYSYFRYYELTKAHFKRLRRKITMAQKHEYKFNIIDVPESSTVDVIKAEIETIMRNSEVKVVFIDYLNILRGPGGKVSLDWQNQIEVAIELKQKIARYFQLPTWSANQLMGSARDKETVYTSDLAFSKNLPDQTDVNFYITQPEDHAETEMLKIGFLKTRDFKAEPFFVKDNRDRMRFSDIKEKEIVEEKIKVTNKRRIQV